MNELFHFFKVVPFWGWLIIPASVFGLATLLIKRDWRPALMVTLVTFGATLAAMGFYLWELYLGKHFIGRYDAQGIPYQFSQSGWHLMVVAWPIWLVPSLAVVTIVLASKWYTKYQYHKWLESKTKKSETTQPPPNRPTLKGKTKEEVMSKLVIEDLTAQLKKKDKVLNSMENASVDTKKIKHLEELLKSYKEENNRLLTDLEEQGDELDEARDLIERFMDEKFEGSDE